MYRGLVIGLLAVAAHGGAMAWTVAPMDMPADTGSVLFAAQQGVSLAQATQIALQRYPGRVVRAETVMRGGRREHTIRILGTDGRVRTVRVDAQSGAIL